MSGPRRLDVQDDARHAGAQGQQDGLRLAAPLRKDEDDPARAQGRHHRHEHLHVLLGIGARVHPPMHGHAVHQPEERGDEGMAEERSLGEHADRPVEGGHDEHGVDEGVAAIGAHHDGAHGGDATPDDIDAGVKEDLDDAQTSRYQTPPRCAGVRCLVFVDFAGALALGFSIRIAPDSSASASRGGSAVRPRAAPRAAGRGRPGCACPPPCRRP